MGNVEIQVQTCALILAIVLCCLNLRRKHLGFLGNKFFYAALSSSVICMVADIASLFAIAYKDSLPILLTVFLCKLYIASLLWVTYCGFGYMVAGIHDVKLKKTLHLYALMTVSIFEAAIFVTPIQISVEDAYTYGPSVMLAYIGCGLFMLATLAYGVVYRKQMNSHHFYYMLLWIGIWVSATVIQFLNEELPLVGFAMVLGLLIIFAQLENPESQCDRDTSAFNVHALTSYIEDCYEEDKTFSLIWIMVQYEDIVLNLGENKFVMVNLAKRLENLQHAFLFRTAASEFVLVFDRQQDMYAAYQHLPELLGKKMIMGTQEVSYELSYLVLTSSTLAINANDVFRIQHYFASLHPDNQVIMIDEEAIAHLHKHERMRMLIDDALANDRVEVFYQPIYSHKAGKFNSAEALVRIRDQQGQLIAPRQFISVAEETGQILNLGLEVFRKVCLFIKTHDMEALGLDYIEVNLSIKQFEDTSLAETYISVINEIGVNPSYINLEVTETAYADSQIVLLQNMKELKGVGVGFSLDDFGTGQSNLNYIMSMPVDIVKFDRVLTQDYLANNRDRIVMEYVVEMLQKMKVKTVAEGVETKEQLDTMINLGIDYIQGFYFSKPIPQDAFLEYIAKENSVEEN